MAIVLFCSESRDFNGRTSIDSPSSSSEMASGWLTEDEIEMLQRAQRLAIECFLDMATSGVPTSVISALVRLRFMHSSPSSTAVREAMKDSKPERYAGSCSLRGLHQGGDVVEDRRRLSSPP